MKRMVSFLYIFALVLFAAMCGMPAQADGVRSGDVPNFLTVYGDKATLQREGYQDRNKYNDEYYRYGYGLEAEADLNVVSAYISLLEKYDIFLADTWKNQDGDQAIYYFEYRGPMAVRPVTTLTSWSEKSRCKPCIVLDVEIYSALRGIGPVYIDLVVSGDLQYLEPDYTAFSPGADAVHLNTGETATLEYTNIPYVYGKTVETCHWKLIDGSGCIELLNDSGTSIRIRGLQAGTAHLLATYEYSVNGSNILTGKPEYQFHSTSQNFTVVVDSGSAGEGESGADVPDFLGFFTQDDFVADAVNDYNEISGEPFIRYYYLCINPQVSINIALACYADGYGSFELMDVTEENQDGYDIEEYFYQYTGPKNVSTCRFEEDDSCAAHMKIKAEYTDGEVFLVTVDLVSGLTYEGDDKFY